MYDKTACLIFLVLVLGLVGGTANATMVSHWMLDDASPSLTAVDSVGNNNGTLTNMVGDEWTTGTVDGALEFDGVSDYVNISGYKGISGSNPRTVTAWVKTDTQGDIVCWGTWGDGTAWIFRAGGQNPAYNGPALIIEAGMSFIHSSVGVNDNQWHHVAVAFGGSIVDDIKLYVDGVPDIGGKANEGYTVNTGNSTDVRIAVHTFSSPPAIKYLNGLSSMVCIWI